MSEAEWAFSVFWMYTVLVDPIPYGMDSRGLIDELGKADIEARPLWQPLHCSPAHAAAQSYVCDVADALHQRGVSLPCSVGLSEEHQGKVIELIRHT